MKIKIKNKGFSLIEVLIGIALVATVMIGLAQLFTLSVMNNLRSSDISNATFLAQQSIDYLRTLTSTELAGFPNTVLGESDDETVDVNSDGTHDFRRIIAISSLGTSFNINVLVFPPIPSSGTGAVTKALLLANPVTYKIKTQIRTIIGR